MVSVSPRLLDDLDTDEELDPRLAWGFQSITLTGQPDHISDSEYHDDARAFASTPDPGAGRRKKRQRESDVAFGARQSFRYATVADGNAFRLVEIMPGKGNSPIGCRLSWEDSTLPKRSYCCLSYCWETAEREADILLDGCRFAVTRNLLQALQNFREATRPILIWIDQICINQDDVHERGHQVSMMRRIFNQGREVFIWLGEASHRSDNLFEYAKKMRRSADDNPKCSLNRILSRRELKDATEKLLERPWFKRVWVISEVALSRHTTVVCGQSRISWDNLVKLIRDVQLPRPVGFHKQASLLGNCRQRIAIVTQMTASQKDSLSHTDITQLLILAKSGEATDLRDTIYAFYGLTYLTTRVDYRITAADLFVEVALMYLNSIRWEASYARQHSLTEEQRTFQLFSILYSAGKLHQDHALPSFVPDWTSGWDLAPLWCRSTPNYTTGSGKDEWSIGIRSDYRAGGDWVQTFEIIEGKPSQLRLSALIIDTVLLVDELTPAPTPTASRELGTSPSEDWHTSELAEIRYGRHFFTSTKGYIGLARRGIEPGDVCAILVGGDVPVILRPSSLPVRKSRVFQLLCECYVQAPAVMFGQLLETDRDSTEHIVLF